MHLRRRSLRWSGAILLLGLTLLVLTGPARAWPPPDETWAWPLAAGTLDRAFAAPAHRYGPGHRGIDIAAVRDLRVHSPHDAVVAFAGQVAGRGVLTLDHGDEIVTTLEPVDPSVEVGDLVERGDVVALLSTGGHTAAGRLHLGVRVDGEYVNPMAAFGGIPRAVLLPCC